MDGGRLAGDSPASSDSRYLLLLPSALDFLLPWGSPISNEATLISGRRRALGPNYPDEGIPTCLGGQAAP